MDANSFTIVCRRTAYIVSCLTIENVQLSWSMNDVAHVKNNSLVDTMHTRKVHRRW